MEDEKSVYYINVILKDMENGLAPEKIIQKFLPSVPSEYSDQIFWRCVFIGLNFGLISKKELARFEQIFEDHYWELGVGYDLYNRNYISDLCVNGKIVGSKNSPITLLLPGGVYPYDFYWMYDDGDICYDDVFFYANSLAPTTVNKTKQRRNSALIELIRIIYDERKKNNEPTSSSDIWKHMIKNKEEYDIIQEITPLSNKDPYIAWISHNYVEQTMKKSTFDKRLSNIRNNKI